MKFLKYFEAKSETNLYDFKKEIKKFLAPFKLFIDNIEINENVEVVIDFHSSDSKIQNNQFYSLLYHYIKREVGWEHEPDFIDLLVDKNKFKENLLLINGGKGTDFFLQKPKFRYISKSSTLSDVLVDFKSKVSSLIDESNPSYTTLSQLEGFIIKEFIRMQKKLLKPLIYDTYESIDTTLTLINPSMKGNYIDVTFKLSIDKNNFVIGNVVLDFENNKYDYQFKTLSELKNIMIQALEFLEFNPANLPIKL